MSKMASPVEFNTFVAGLVTEASYLNFPDNASVDEVNFVLNRDGTRQRRLGIDYEGGYEIKTAISSESSKIVSSSILWKNAGGIEGASILVVQIGNNLNFFSTTSESISPNRIYSYELTTSSTVNNIKAASFAVVDGILVVAYGEDNLLYFNYDGTDVTSSSFRIKCRDTFGLEDYVYNEDGDLINLREGANLDYRPIVKNNTLQHQYNCLNQGWASKRLGYSHTYNVPYSYFIYMSRSIKGVSKFYANVPSNAETPITSIYQNVASSYDPVVERFNAKSAVNVHPTNTEAPRGFFIIDLLSRGFYRSIELYKEVNSESEIPTAYEYEALVYGENSIASFNLDKTEGGASCVCDYAGRFWYAGFSSEVTDPDEHSPRLGSYIFFSKLIESTADLGVCYQIGDPTSKDNSDILSTDGGYIKLDSAYNIVKLINLRDSLAVFSENGVWIISGTSNGGFSATGYSVSKISEKGCISGTSVVLVEGSVLYWGLDGIYSLAPNDLGDYSCTNITRNNIQSLYTSIDSLSKESCSGIYDSYDRKVRWLYNTDYDSTDVVSELILNVDTGAFYKNSINSITADKLPLLKCPVETLPYTLQNIQNVITANDIEVTANGDTVYIPSTVKISGARSVKYVTITSIGTASSGNLSYNFTLSSYNNNSFVDWESYDTVGVDASAYLVTGWVSGGDLQRKKNVPYLTMHFKRTEDGFEDIAGDIIPTNESSCLIQAQWSWADSAASGKWGKTFQGYRYRRVYMPSGVSDDYDIGMPVITTRNKLRGSGEVISLKMSTEAGKDCNILGWSMVLEGNSNV